MVFVQIVRALPPSSEKEKKIMDALRKFNNTLHAGFNVAERLIVSELSALDKEYKNDKIKVQRNEISNISSSLVIEKFLSFNLIKTTLWQ
jgi:hypothetical protein